VNVISVTIVIDLISVISVIGVTGSIFKKHFFAKGECFYSKVKSFLLALFWLKQYSFFNGS